ncbi:unnamed protein product [Gongylonema pulchrum]|uniref:Ground-like domain-containing protein n=1 Tax=Gongylonema pulchrum TaxID=637853 RepID=A0A183DCW4_9BILA|nr:unnamed protein product [Gongylonema pulchrum]
MKKDPARTKRAIQRAAESKLLGKYNVICSKGDFNYITHTTEYCEASSRHNTCYAFKSG